MEFHLDLDTEGAEYSTGHCWLPEEMAPVIEEMKQGLEADGHGLIEPGQSEDADRMWRADPEDGLRPLKSIRSEWLRDRMEAS